MSLLSKLRAEAQSKRDKDQLVVEDSARQEKDYLDIIQPKMVALYSHLSQLCELLNYIDEDVYVSYEIKNYGVLEKLRQVDYKLKADSIEKMKRIRFTFSCKGNGRLDFDVQKKLYIDRLIEHLDKCRVVYTCKKQKDSKHNITDAVFRVEQHVSVDFDFTVDVERHAILLNVTNYSELITDRFVIPPDDIDENFFEELGKYIVRRDSNLFKLGISEEEREQLRKKLKGQKGKKNKLKQKDKRVELQDKPKAKSSRGFIGKAKNDEPQHSTNNISGEKTDELLQEAKEDSDISSDKVQQHLDVEKENEQAKVVNIEEELDDSTEDTVEDEDLTSDKVLQELEKFDQQQINLGEIKPAINDLENDLADFKLEFVFLPSAYRAVSSEELDIKYHLQHLIELENFPLQLIYEATKILENLNKSKIDAIVRLDLAKGIFSHAYPVMERLLDEYDDTLVNVLEGQERENLLPYCTSFVEQVCITCKHTYAQFYTTDKNGFLKRRSDLIKWGFFILEMTRLEQILRALRYQKLPSYVWRDCNQVFFSLLYHNNIDEVRTLSSTLALKRLQNASKEKGALTSCVRKLYLSIQLFGVMDVITWPYNLFDFPDTYLEYCDEVLKIELDSGKKLIPGWMITFLRNDGPPIHRRNDVIPVPAVRIDFSLLFNKLVAEHEALAAMMFISSVDTEKLSKPLADLDEQDRIPVLEMMLLSMKPRERHHVRHNVYKKESLVVSFGFSESYKIFSGYAVPNKEGGEDAKKCIEMIQEKSMVLANDALDQKATEWQIVNFSSGGILVSGEDSKNNQPVQIGQILAFKPGNEAKRPLIGFVGRIQRVHETQLEVSVIRLANYAEAAIIQDPNDDNPDAEQPAILVQDFDNRWQLILQDDVSRNYKAGAPLKLIRSGGERILLRLGDIWLRKRSFTVFEVRSAGLES